MIMPLAKSILLTTLPSILAVSAFQQPPANSSIIHRRQHNDVGQGQGLPHRPATQLRMAKQRKVMPAKKSRQKKKQQTLESLLELESDLQSRGYNYVIGSDDSGGAGCIAGPVVTASCCCLKPFSSFLPIEIEASSSESESESLLSESEMETLSKVNDCKDLTPIQRQEIYGIVQSHPEIFAVSIAERSPKEIDDINLTRATQEAFAESIETLVEKGDFPFKEVYAIVDGKVSPKLYASRREQSNSPKEESETLDVFSVRPYVNGDAHVYTVALSSIMARVARDDRMQEIHEQYPLYGFADHGGYGRRDHIEVLHRLGSLEGVHRMSFKQVKGR